LPPRGVGGGGWGGGGGGGWNGTKKKRVSRNEEKATARFFEADFALCEIEEEQQRNRDGVGFVHKRVSKKEESVRS